VVFDLDQGNAPPRGEPFRREANPDAKRRWKVPEVQAPASAEALRKQVEDRAYALWESQGRLHGRDVEDWLQAETEVMAARGTSTSVNAPSSTASPAARKTKAETSSD
jgi:hypothetical protein